MLFYFTDYLSSFDSGFHVFHYLTFRAILAVLTSLVISFMIGPWMIRKLSREKLDKAFVSLARKVIMKKRVHQQWAAR